MRRLVGIGLLCAFAAFGQGKGNGKGKGKGHSEDGGTSSSVQFSFGRDQNVIREYYRAVPPNNLPPGLAKRGGDLPPGLEKQLRRNGRLPPDYGRAFIGGRAVIYNKSTSVVLDVFIPF